MQRESFFSKQTLTEKLIEAVPDIDIHIIPDAMNLDNYRKPHGAVYVGKPTMKDSLLTLFIFAVCTLIGLFIQKLQFTDTKHRYNLYFGCFIKRQSLQMDIYTALEVLS